VTAAASKGFAFVAELWQWDGPAAWHFVSLPDDVADEIDERWGHVAAGFKSVRVQVTVGRTTWRTSLFPDNKRGTYLLPVKQAVRKAEDLVAGAPVAVAIEVLL
jgi:hypothetical protein